LPGPGPESAIQKFCGAEYERVYAIAHRMLRDSTGIQAERAEELARRIAGAHSDALFERLETGGRAGGGRARSSRDERGMQQPSPSRAREMHRSPAVARMGV
jgi:hypothetical protein